MCALEQAFPNYFLFNDNFLILLVCLWKCLFENRCRAFESRAIGRLHLLIRIQQTNSREMSSDFIRLSSIGACQHASHSFRYNFVSSSFVYLHMRVIEQVSRSKFPKSMKLSKFIAKHSTNGK